jgi:hypothetical protein
MKDLDTGETISIPMTGAIFVEQGYLLTAERQDLLRTTEIGKSKSKKVS